MSALSEIHNRELSETLTEVYWKVLEPFSDEEAVGAINRAILTCKFFPKPAEIVELLTQKTEDRAALAWIEVEKAVRHIGNYQSVKFGDSVIHSCLEAMGGWYKVSEWSEDEMKWKRKEFEGLYKIMEKQKKHPVYLPGLMEIENRAKDFGNFVQKPVLIGGGNGEIRRRIEGGDAGGIRAAVCGDSGDLSWEGKRSDDLKDGRKEQTGENLQHH